MKKYLKITIVFALTVAIVATMCILPTFAAFVEETVTITDKSQLEVGVTYTTLNFDVATSPSFYNNPSSNDFDISCGGRLYGEDSIDEEYVYKTIEGFDYTYSDGDGIYNIKYNGSSYPFYKNLEFAAGGQYLRVDIASSSDKILVEKFLLTDIEFSSDDELNRFSKFIGDNFSASYIGLVEVPDPPSPTDSITGVFTNISGWIVNAIGNTVPMFYNAQASELTILGVLAVAGLAIAVIFLLINVIKRFIQFRS